MKCKKNRSAFQEDAWAFERLCTILQKTGSVSIAYSGGLDSRFLAYAAQRAGLQNIELLHIWGPHVLAEERVWARVWAEQNVLSFQEFFFDPLQIKELQQNVPLRCLYCKRALFKLLQKHACFSLLEGSTASDAKLFRPGWQAVQEGKVGSPLFEAGLTKPMLRRLGRALGLTAAEQPARPCLLTRLPYGMFVTRSLLEWIARAEALVAEQFSSDFAAVHPEYRVRVFQNGTAALHLKAGSVCAVTKRKIQSVFMENGFASVSIIEQESISGYFDSTNSMECLPERINFDNNIHNG